MTPQETDPDLPMSVQERPTAGSGALSEAGGRHFLPSLHHSLVSGQKTWREHSPAHQQKSELKISLAWTCPSEQDQVSPTVSLYKEGSIRVLSLSEGRQNENQNHRGNQMITWTATLSNSMKL